jgi:hypothetical protein
MQQTVSTPDFRWLGIAPLRVNPGPRNTGYCSSAGPEVPVCMRKDLDFGRRSWLERVKCASDLTSPMMGI